MPLVHFSETSAFPDWPLSSNKGFEQQMYVTLVLERTMLKILLLFDIMESQV